jgi:hypothetical protein
LRREADPHRVEAIRPAAAGTPLNAKKHCPIGCGDAE